MMGSNNGNGSPERRDGSKFGYLGGTIVDQQENDYELLDVEGLSFVEDHPNTPEANEEANSVFLAVCDVYLPTDIDLLAKIDGELDEPVQNSQDEISPLISPLAILEDVTWELVECLPTFDPKRAERFADYILSKPGLNGEQSDYLKAIDQGL